MADISKIILPNNEEYNLKDTKARQDINLKADKVNNATNNNFAALDENGNLKDSGHKHSDYLTEHQSLAAYRTAAAQDTIDAGKETAGLGLTGASVGDIVRVAAVDANGKPTSWQKVPLCEIVTNENLLDNWYFVGGGSQLGNGVFPINQRGQTSYTGAVFGIDRWYVTSGSSSQVTIDTDGIIYKNTVYTNRISQHAPILLSGKTVTLSALCTAIDGARYAVTIQTNAGNSTTTFTTDEIASVTFTIPAAATEINAQIRLEDTGASVKIHAMKLELGFEQTLAYWDGTKWVLNELPDYETELIKCKTSTADSTDNYANKTIGYNVSNRNLLDNWYFVGGGSQRTDVSEAFPINQRGKSSYTSGYGIDRWALSFAGIITETLPDTNEYLRLTRQGTSGNPAWVQVMPDNLVGKVVTVSLLYRGVIQVNGARLFAAGKTSSWLSSSNDWTLLSVTVTAGTLSIGNWTDKVLTGIQLRSNMLETDYIDVKAFKVEIGTEQTLAHQEGGAWVLNEIPDYGEELAKCQKYLIAFKTSSNTRSLLALGFAESASQYRAVLPTPVTMNHSSNRPVELTGTVTAGSLTASSVSSFWEENPGSITLFVNVTGATVGDITKIMLESSSTLIISAE